MIILHDFFLWKTDARCIFALAQNQKKKRIGRNESLKGEEQRTNLSACIPHRRIIHTFATFRRGTRLKWGQPGHLVERSQSILVGHACPFFLTGLSDAINGLSKLNSDGIHSKDLNWSVPFDYLVWGRWSHMQAAIFGLAGTLVQRSPPSVSHSDRIAVSRVF